MVSHYFGGAWTEIKLEVLERYLNFYTTALKNQKFNLIYIDAFAGTGERYEKIPGAPLLKEEEKEKVSTGSAVKALSVQTPFDIYYFIENNKHRLDRLKQIGETYPNRRTCFSLNDANDEIVKICKSINWNKYRAVLFLDPYGLDVDWSTLQAINDTKSIDIWYLFSLSGFYRQASKKKDSIESYKVEKINKILGTNDWINRIYTQQPKKQVEMFELNSEGNVRDSSVQEFEDFVTERLEQLFPHVSQPLALPKTGAQLYSLYFCVSNPNRKAIDVAKRASDYILKMHE